MKTQVCLFVVVVAVFSLEVQAQGKRPDYLALCARRDPQFNKCMVERIREIVPDLLAGDPELDLPALNPVHIAELSIDTDITEDVRSRMFFKDINIYNTDSVQIKNVRSNINDNKLELEVDIQFPKLFLDGEYRSDVRFRGLPFINKGSFNLTLVFVRTRASSMTPSQSAVRIANPHFQSQAPFLIPTAEWFDSNAALSIANKYWFIFYNESLPFLEEKWDTIMTDIANNVFLKVPYDHMFPSD
uniref:(California timema) hypothetical protein n=1 Tax=Timema californicum TaxID=61474 RepID=A0A7R9P3B9_TIMCA|nr:unnamed protein product [Timema californicum]